MIVIKYLILTLLILTILPLRAFAVSEIELFKIKNHEISKKYNLFPTSLKYIKKELQRKHQAVAITLNSIEIKIKDNNDLLKLQNDLKNKNDQIYAQELLFFNELSNKGVMDDDILYLYKLKNNFEVGYLKKKLSKNNL